MTFYQYRPLPWSDVTSQIQVLAEEISDMEHDEALQTMSRVFRALCRVWDQTLDAVRWSEILHLSGFMLAKLRSTVGDEWQAMPYPGLDIESRLVEALVTVIQCGGYPYPVTTLIVTNDIQEDCELVMLRLLGLAVEEDILTGDRWRAIVS